MKNKLLASIVATTVITATIPVSAMALTTEAQENNTTVVEQVENEGCIDLKTNTTTPSAVEVKPVVTVDFNNECDNVNEALKNFKTSNDTTEQEVLNNVKNSVDGTINIEFGTEVGQTFNKVNATTIAGSITGTLVIKDNFGNSKDIQVNLSIEQLSIKNVNTVPFEQPVIQNQTEIPTDETVTTSAAVIINTQEEVTKLDAVINSAIKVGDTISPNITGYDKDNNIVNLDITKLTYKWFADGELVSQDKDLLISKDLDKKDIKCVADYPDGQGGVK